MIVALGQHHFTSLKLTEGVLEIGDGPFRISYRSLVAPQDLRIVGCLAEKLGGLEDLALCLYPLVDILYLLVELMRLISFIRT